MLAVLRFRGRDYCISNCMQDSCIMSYKIINLLLCLFGDKVCLKEMYLHVRLTRYEMWCLSLIVNLRTNPSITKSTIQGGWNLDSISGLTPFSLKLSQCHHELRNFVPPCIFCHVVPALELIDHELTPPKLWTKLNLTSFKWSMLDTVSQQ